MHKKAWLSQAGMMTYPDSLAPIMKNKWFGDPIEYHDLDLFARDYSKNQLKDAVVEVQPLLPQDGFEDGVVQFANDNIEGVLKLNVAFTQLPPSKEDFWLAQEDLWMKRELLRIVRAANDSVARFHPTDEEQTCRRGEEAGPSERSQDAGERRPQRSWAGQCKARPCRSSSRQYSRSETC